jgi:glutamate-1-semialdehyde 2,1-aminomutase
MTRIPQGGVAERENLVRRARQVIPGGASAGGRPLFGDAIVRARGAYLWNADGTRFVDHLNACGAIVIGHADRRVNRAVAGTAATVDLNGVGAQAGEVELAERIVRTMPSADKVAFMNTGTDALQHALHVARAATGRCRVFTFHGHYHGWVGQLRVGASLAVERGLASPPAASNSGASQPGLTESVEVVDWNDFEATHAAFAVRGREYAAIVVEPYLHSYTNAPPAPGFLELLRELADRHGAVLVFDEVKTGFRHHLGGYQVIAGVTPDLTAFGKALGNGYTIAGLAGWTDLMDLLGVEVSNGGTYYASPYALAAGIATFDILENGGVERLWALGERLRDGLALAIRAAGVTANVTGIGSGWIINWRADPPVTFRQAVDADFDRGETFRLAMLDAGILLPPCVIADARINLAFTDDDVDETIEAAGRALRAAA